MQKRIAYIGVSCPVFYDYKNQAAKAPNDISSSPNPILESPYGLMLLYDELWFLCESFCPGNMRGLGFVNYVDVLFPDMDFSAIEKAGVAGTAYFDKFNRGNTPTYGELVNEFHIDENLYSLDNHTHGIELREARINGNTTTDNLAFDMNVVLALNQMHHSPVELITNSYTSCLVGESTNAQRHLAESLTIRNIPNFLTPAGPYHPVVEEAREDAYLKAFRQWITEYHSHISKSEIADIQAEVENTMQTKMHELFLQWLDASSCYRSIGETVLTSAIGAVVPLYPTAKDILSIVNDAQKSEEARANQWQGFVLNAKHKYFK